VKLFLCEKPSQARNIARVLGIRQQGDGYLQSNNTVVTWCFGHLLEMLPPDAYDKAYKRWRFETLPIVPKRWKLEVKKAARQQYKIVQHLLHTSSEVVVATDADREGETIAREVLERCRWRGATFRLWLSALDDASIRKALASILPGAKTEPLYFAGLGRARADWLVGMNLTRAYTLIGQQNGHEGVLSVGRVQTPTLNLVVQRDLSIEQFKATPYYDVYARFAVSNGQFTAKWLPPKTVADTEGRCIDPSAAHAVIQKIKGQQGQISKADITREKEPPPLPFDLSSLQQDASRRWGIGAKDVLDTAQALYETHKALTYPRTDCRYLPQSQRAEVESVLAAIKRSDNRYTPLVDNANPTQATRMWNDKKVTAHHAIIPTATPTNISRMTEKERRIYALVCRHYIAQFYPAFEYDKTVIDVSIKDERFRTTGKVPRIEGWRIVLVQNKLNKQDDQNQTLPNTTVGETADVLKATLETKQTKPPVRYTEGTLIAAMKSIGKLITDTKLKKVLRETSGIGTEATRANIIETLLQRDFLQKQKKQIVSTQTGRALIAILPDEIKDPITTALWEQELDDIAQGRGDLNTFIDNQTQWVTDILHRATQQSRQNNPMSQPFSESNREVQHACPDCSSPLQRRKGKNGFFWGCSAYPHCKTTYPDNRGKPGNTKPRSASRRTASITNAGELSAKAGSLCPQCKSGTLVQRSVKTGKNAGKPFTGCTDYPKCNYFSWQSQ